MDLGDELLESLGRAQVVDGGAQLLRHQRLVIGEAKIDEFSAAGHGGFAIRRNQAAQIGQRFDLPHKIVARDQPFENAIQSRQPGA